MEANFKFLDQNRRLNYELDKLGDQVKDGRYEGDLQVQVQLARKENLSLRDSSKIDQMKIMNQQQLIDQQFEIIKDYSEQIEMGKSREYTYIERIQRLE